MATTEADVKPELVVVAGILADQSGRILVAQRPAGKNLAGYWEFPGGKLEIGETPAQALKREFREELDLSVEESHAYMQVKHEYDSFGLLLLVRQITACQGIPRGCEGQKLAWLYASEMQPELFPPADLEIIHRLKVS